MKKVTMEEAVEYQFDDEEKKANAMKLANTITKLYETKTEAKETAAEYKGTIAELENEIAEMTQIVREGKTTVVRDCEVVFDWKTGVKAIIHPVTGVVVRTLPITKQDRQFHLVE